MMEDLKYPMKDNIVPVWAVLMFLIIVTCGNTFILKPSKRDSAACLTLAELGTEAGLPNGVLNVIHGTNDNINAICDSVEIKAVSFVGPDTILSEYFPWHGVSLN
ncbi:hypothetical protein AgCh_005348 [Apium graveolens]